MKKKKKKQRSSHLYRCSPRSALPKCPFSRWHLLVRFGGVRKASKWQHLSLDHRFQLWRSSKTHQTSPCFNPWVELHMILYPKIISPKLFGTSPPKRKSSRSPARTIYDLYGASRQAGRPNGKIIPWLQNNRIRPKGYVPEIQDDMVLKQEPLKVFNPINAHPWFHSHIEPLLLLLVQRITPEAPKSLGAAAKRKDSASITGRVDIIGGANGQKKHPWWLYSTV